MEFRGWIKNIREKWYIYLIIIYIDAHKRGILTGIINEKNEVITSGGDCGMRVWNII